MKRIVILLCSIICIYFFFSCDEKDTFTNTITLEKDILEISSLEQSLNLKVITKSDFSVTSDCDWLSVNKNFSEKESTINITIQENTDSLSSRTATISLNSLSNDATAILYITQNSRSIIRLLTLPQVLSSDRQDITILVKSNCKFNVIIPEEASDWISLASTKAMIDSNITLSISRNITYYRRASNVFIKNESDGVQDTLSIIQDEGFQSLRITMRDNPNASIFYSALVATHLDDTLTKYMDDSYPTPGYDSTITCLKVTGKVAVEYETAYETGNQRQRVVWPTERLFKYTLFTVPDSILANIYNIHNLDELEAFAKIIYDDPEHINDDKRLSTSPLYKLIAYHILPFWANYDELNFTNEKIVDDYVKNGIEENDAPKMIDMQDFYETMQPYAIMRISTPYDPKAGGDKGKIFINRKGTVSGDSLTHRGIMIRNPQEYESLKNQIVNTLNGGYYYVDSLLLFDQHTKDALRTRIRVMGTTLSPDFMNSVRRDRMRVNDNLPTTFAVTAFKKGYCRNFSATEHTQLIVRYQDKGWGCYMHDQAMIRGDYDLTLRLPPVPENDTYEIRIWGNALGTSAPKRDRGYVQFYFQEGNGNPVPCGLPVNMGLRPEDPQIGFVKDEDLKKDKSEQEGQDAIIANDKAMRNRGYMKAPKSAQANGTNFRDEAGCFRKIICEQYMEAGKDYYLRFKKADDDETVLDLCFIEIVPYSIYSGLNGLEDIY